MTDGLKTVEGNLTTLDPEKRSFTLENRDGVIFFRVDYDQKFDQKMQKQKIGYYEKPTVELTGESSGRLVDLPYVARPEGFPRIRNTSSGGNNQASRKFAPRNEKPVVFESVLKTCSDLMRDGDMAGSTYEQRVAAVWGQAKAISLEIIKESGC